MNYKSLAIIALVLMAVLAVPASAEPVWSAGNYVTDGRYDNCDSVQYNPKTDVYSCYRDINPANEIKGSLNGNGGKAVGSIRAGYSTLSDTIEVRNVLQEANITGMIIKVLPDATFEIPPKDEGVLAPGEYDALLDNYDVKDEIVRFTIAADQQEPTRISFIGQAVSPAEQVQVVVTPEPCEPHYVYVGYCHGDYKFVHGHQAYYEIVLWGEHTGHASIVSTHDVEHHGAQYDFKVGGVYFRITSGGPIKYLFHEEIQEHYEFVGHNHGEYDLVTTCEDQTPK